jgi:hypothetical protein
MCRQLKIVARALRNYHSGLFGTLDDDARKHVETIMNEIASELWDAYVTFDHGGFLELCGHPDYVK